MRLLLCAVLALAEEKIPSLQDQFTAGINRARELRGVDTAVESFTRRHKRERKDRQRQRREGIAPGCEDKMCDRRARQEERRRAFEAARGEL